MLILIIIKSYICININNIASLIVKMNFEQALKRCTILQQRLKYQYLLLSTEQDQKSILQKKLNIALKNYYRNFIQLDINVSSQITQKTLFQDQGFGNCYIFIKQTILGLSKNPDIMLALIKKHNSWEKIQGFSGIIRTIIGSMYQNVVDDELSHKDILYFMNGIIKIIVNSKNHLEKGYFTEPTLVYEILRQFTKKVEFTSYTNQVVASTLLELAKLDRLIDYSFQDQQDLRVMQKILSKGSDSPSKTKSSSKNTAQSSFSDIKTIFSKSQAYSEALRKKDSKIRTTAAIRTKNKNCVSSELMMFLKINENINFPVFLSSLTENDLKEEEQINNQWTIILNRNDSNNYLRRSTDVTLVKNLIFIFFTDLFKMLYSMPTSMRIICRLMFNELFSKNKNRKLSLNVVGNFVIGYWVLSALQIGYNVSESSKISDFTNRNAETIKKVIIGIIRNDLQGIENQFVEQFNIIASNLRLSIFNYLNQLINIQTPNFDLTQEAKDIKSYCVCLSIADIQRILKMIKECAQQINPINDKIVKKVQRIYQMSDGIDIFGVRKDIQTNKQYKNSQSFVLFMELILPKQLSLDYHKIYNDAFKKQKTKNVLKQVLLNISDINQYFQFPSQCTSLRYFFQYLIRTRQERLNLHALDHIPVQLRLKYLVHITKEYQIQQLIETMLKQSKERLQSMSQIWDKSKECFLKAYSSVIRESQKISYNQINFKQELKKKKIQQFMRNAKVNVCITSPRTREKEIILKTNMMKEISSEQRSRIWLNNQSKCIHSALNLEFIRALTGEGEKNKVKYESHISQPYKFAQILCALPEVKQKGMSCEDNVGIKQTITQFLQFCIEVIKSDPEYLILAEDINWLYSNLQQRISKKIYDKLYPKMITYDDLGMYFRLKTLDWINYEHLRINKFMRIDGMWDIAAKHLKKMDKMKTASQKLDCIVQCSQFLMKSYSLIGTKDYQPITPDDIYPIVVNVLIKAAPRRLVSNLNFIEMFTNSNRLMNEDGYFFSQLKSAVKYLECLSHDQIGVQLIDFNKMIYEKEIQYGVYFLLPRRKQSPRTVMNKIEYLKSYFKKKKKQGQKQKGEQQFSNQQNARKSSTKDIIGEGQRKKSVR